MKRNIKRHWSVWPMNFHNCIFMVNFYCRTSIFLFLLKAKKPWTSEEYFIFVFRDLRNELFFRCDLRENLLCLPITHFSYFSCWEEMFPSATTKQKAVKSWKCLPMTTTINIPIRNANELTSQTYKSSGSP